MIAPVPDDDSRVMFTPLGNGRDWVTLPVSAIKDARLIAATASDPALSHAELSLSLRSDDNTFAHLTSMLSPELLSLRSSLPPPPSCPGVARWVRDHWECT